jgi:hypothetical protein
MNVQHSIGYPARRKSEVAARIAALHIKAIRIGEDMGIAIASRNR